MPAWAAAATPTTTPPSESFIATIKNELVHRRTLDAPATRPASPSSTTSRPSTTRTAGTRARLQQPERVREDPPTSGRRRLEPRCQPDGATPIRPQPPLRRTRRPLRASSGARSIRPRPIVPDNPLRRQPRRPEDLDAVLGGGREQAAMSGGPSGAGGMVSDRAGSASARMKPSNPAGSATSRKRASGERPTNVCGTSRGPNTNDPAGARSPRHPPRTSARRRRRRTTRPRGGARVAASRPPGSRGAR